MDLRLRQNAVSWRPMQWRLIASVLSVVAVVAQAGAAVAEELTNWGYDSQTREISVVLPATVAPSLSVLAPNQLLIELPNTQIGDVAGQSVSDGVVESIVLEQTAPETVWMVVEFVPGTVLADVQNATQTPVEEGFRQWQVQPALMASRRTLASPIATMPAEMPAAETSTAETGSAADRLRSPSVTVAQAGDFSDLPVLEPAMPMNEPVSVPPIDVAPRVEVPPIEIPVISEAEPVESDLSVADEEGFDPQFGTGIRDEVAADEAFTAEEALPFEPPFIGEVGNDATSEPIVEVPVIAAPSAGQIAELPPSAPWLNEPAAVVEPVPVVDEPPVQTVTPNNVDRWPEPVPFGQPLP
ncbi:MAG: hypothetical protein AAFP03_03910 [Cyanobacteria bacterium J06598_3]